MKINLPTKVTLIRMALIPLVLILYYLKVVHPVFILLMTIVYMIASGTDAVDGYLARSRNMVTTLGKFLDPIADKVLVVTGLFIIVDSGVLSWGRLGLVGSVIIMARELAISAFRQIAATKGVVMAADKLGKAKTLCTLLALPSLFIGMYKDSWFVDNNFVNVTGSIFWWIGLVLFVASVVLTIWSGINYIVTNKDVLRDEKKESADNASSCDNVEEMTVETEDVKEESATIIEEREFDNNSDTTL